MFRGSRQFSRKERRKVTLDLEGPVLIGAEKFHSVGGALCCGWGRGIKFGEGQVAEEGESVANPCGVILSLDSGASLAGSTAQLCRRHS